MPDVHKRTAMIVEVAPMPHPDHWNMLVVEMDNLVDERGYSARYLETTRAYIEKNILPEAHRQFLVD